MWTAHSVARREIASCTGDDLSTGRMIRGLDANDLGFKGAVMLVHELEEFELRRGGPDDEDRVYPVEFSCHVVEEMLDVIPMFSRLPTPFRVTVNMVLRREDRGLVCRLMKFLTSIRKSAP